MSWRGLDVLPLRVSSCAPRTSCTRAVSSHSLARPRSPQLYRDSPGGAHCMRYDGQTRTTSEKHGVTEGCSHTCLHGTSSLEVFPSPVPHASVCAVPAARLVESLP